MRRAICLAVCLGGAIQGFASATVTHHGTGALSVHGSVSQHCSFTTSPVAFPNIGTGYIHAKGNTVTKQTSLIVHCTKGAVVLIAMNAGLYGSKAGAQFGSRSMKSSPGNSYLGYDLCHDSACAKVWTPLGFTYTSPSDTGSSLPVWGFIKSGQNVAQGSYSDAVTVTVSF